MFENFQLGAVVGRGLQISLDRIPLHQEAQQNLAETWKSHYDDFVYNIREIDFVPGYKPENDERFRVTISAPPDWLRDQSSETIRNCDSIGSSEADLGSIKGLAAFVRDDQGQELVLLQNFMRSRVLRPGRTLLLERGTYTGMRQPGLVLDSRLSAVYQRESGKLLFTNFRTVNTFLPLSDFYRELSERDIRAILGHPLLAPEDVDALAVNANQWFRVRFAMLADSRILDKYSIDQICSHAEGYPVQITVVEGRIVFPAEKAQAKRLLQYLNEELFHGAITETLYETNSKRIAD